MAYKIKITKTPKEYSYKYVVRVDDEIVGYSQTKKAGKILAKREMK
jgi:hypothetical protein